MPGAGYITLEDIVSEDFLEKPKTLVVEAGNGAGKTYRASELTAILQPLKRFERIYFLGSSQKVNENIVGKIVSFGGKVVWHIGVEKFCPMKSLREKLRRLGIPENYACYFCPYFRNKQRLAFTIFSEELQDSDTKIVKPKVYTLDVTGTTRVCTQPIIRAFTLEPRFEVEKRLSLGYTPVIVAPSQVMLNHTIIGRWSEFSRRQRRERRNLMIVDEADNVFYSSLRVEIPFIDFTEFDQEVLEKFSLGRGGLQIL